MALKDKQKETLERGKSIAVKNIAIPLLILGGMFAMATVFSESGSSSGELGGGTYGVLPVMLVVLVVAFGLFMLPKKSDNDNEE